VAPNGAKRWFWKYRFGGKERRIALGHYSEPGSKAVVVGLKEAREAAIESRRVLKTGTDPIQRRKADTATKAVARRGASPLRHQRSRRMPVRS